MEAKEMTTIARIKLGAGKIEQAAKLIIVKDDESLAMANKYLTGVKALQKEIDGVFDPTREKMRAAINENLAQKRKYEEPLRKAERYLKGQIGPYLIKQERILQEKIERDRREKEEAERKLREAEEERHEKAKDLQRLGKEEEAQKVMEESLPEIKATKPEAPMPAASKGVHTRKIRKWRLKDFSLVPREYLKLDEIKIGSLVRSTKAKIEIPGIEIYSEDIVATREEPLL